MRAGLRVFVSFCLSSTFFITHLSPTLVCLYATWCVFTLNFLSTASVKKKLLQYCAILLCSVCWGGYHDLDGLMLLFFSAELLVLFILCLVYTQIFTQLRSGARSLPVLPAGMLFVCVGVFCGVWGPVAGALCGSLWVDYYAAQPAILTNDFYLVFFFFYIAYPLITCLLLTCMGTFSIFFILLYFSLHSLLRGGRAVREFKVALRKQHAQRQATYTSFMRWMQC